MEHAKNIEYYPKSVSIKGIERILEQMKKTICKINIVDNTATAFFCKIPYPDNNYLIPVLITNNHIIDEIVLKKEKKLLILINNEKKEIELENRIKYTNKEYDITIIEIKEKDRIDNFLEIDNIKRSNESYIGESIYILNYSNKQIKVSYGIIKEDNKENKNEFSSICNIEKDSSGGPILNLGNNRVIGIYKGKKEDNNNIGLFIKYGINKFLNFTRHFEYLTKINLARENIEDKELKVIIENVSKIRTKKLKELYLDNNNISDIKILEKIKSEILDLSSNKISNINILDSINFKELKELYLYDNNISDIKVLEKAKFEKLIKLDLGKNKLLNINVLENVNFKELKKLNLSHNDISDIKVLEKVKFEKLEKLDLGNNLIDKNKLSSIMKNFKFIINI